MSLNKLYTSFPELVDYTDLLLNLQFDKKQLLSIVIIRPDAAIPGSFNQNLVGSHAFLSDGMENWSVPEVLEGADRVIKGTLDIIKKSSVAPEEKGYPRSARSLAPLALLTSLAHTRSTFKKHVAEGTIETPEGEEAEYVLDTTAKTMALTLNLMANMDEDGYEENRMAPLTIHCYSKGPSGGLDYHVITVAAPVVENVREFMESKLSNTTSPNPSAMDELEGTVSPAPTVEELDAFASSILDSLSEEN